MEMVAVVAPVTGDQCLRHYCSSTGNANIRNNEWDFHTWCTSEHIHVMADICYRHRFQKDMLCSYANVAFAPNLKPESD